MEKRATAYQSIKLMRAKTRARLGEALKNK
jgi:hypothetical protein